MSFCSSRWIGWWDYWGPCATYLRYCCQFVWNLHLFQWAADFQDTRQMTIDNITNTLSDGCAANHAGIRIVNSEWGKSLNELYCHLHPLDSIAAPVRSALKKHKQSRAKVLFGKDCLTGNVILQMKCHDADGKGDPKGFVVFLDEGNIPCGVLPWYRGNRLHILSILVASS